MNDNAASETSVKNSSRGKNDNEREDKLAFARETFRSSADTLDITTAEIKALPKLRSSLSIRLTDVAKALYIFKDRKKKRVDENHKLFLTAHCIRDAIKYTTNQRLNDSTKVEVEESSFLSVERTTLPVIKIHRKSIDKEQSTSFKASPSPSSGKSSDETFEFKEYAPDVFLKLRHLFGISQEAYMKSVGSQGMYLDFQSNSKSEQFFFFSDDKFFLIKTLTHQEVLWFMDCLAKYYHHLIRYPNTLLVKFMGLYRIKVPRGRKMGKVHFVIMRSTFDTCLPMHKKFDLKGSRVGREASESDKKKLFPVLKDNDLEQAGIQFHLQPEKDEFLKQLDIDCALLKSLKMMDYSLLIGIFEKRRVDAQHHITDHTIREILKQENCLHYNDRLDDHGLIYFMGIIDILQNYNAGKKLETIAKGVVNNRKEISSVKPSFYAKRLVNFITKFCAD